MANRETDMPLRVLLGVTGGVAAYKAPELVRRLRDRGAEVQVVLSQGARQFVSAVTFQAVSGRPVRDDLWDPAAESAMGHIELARWADLVVIAPATAHCLGTLAHGLAGDLLSTLCIASSAPLFLAPAMNQAMWANPAVQANRQLLAERGARFIGPDEGDQACGDQGTGRMAEPEAIAAAVLDGATGLGPVPFRGLKVVITAGPTREPIDPVRYVTNRSSGKMGFALAAAAREGGGEVVLVSGPVGLATPGGVRRVDVETAQQMYEAVHSEIADTDIFIACAAVSDYRPETVARQKLKRTDERMQLELVRSLDTLASVAALPRPPFTVGFAAETEHVAAHARQKLERKGVDMIAANLVGPGCGFDCETNSLAVYWQGGDCELGESPKRVLAARLVELIAEHYGAARGKRRAPAAV
jgi:phosphopantothenoylcysteine decarboxylase / phosphopantothenate---cysteine ligase